VGASKLEIASSASNTEESLEVEVRILSSGLAHNELTASPLKHKIPPLIIYHPFFLLSIKNRTRMSDLAGTQPPCDAPAPREFAPTSPAFRD
jgi:hypothetical protein